VSSIKPGDLYSSDWPGFKQIFKLEREVREAGRVTNTTSYAITSVPPGMYTAAQWLQIWRNHWGIENRCFYVRDVTLREDASRLRTGEAPRTAIWPRSATPPWDFSAAWAWKMWPIPFVNTPSTSPNSPAA
jgi:hypothetical protein